MRVGVFGAGAIGCYLGGRLQAHGHEVVFVGRASMKESLAAGLVLSDQSTKRVTIPAEQLTFELSARALADCDYVLVTVKSAGTPNAGVALAEVLHPRTVTVSFQNGVKNVERLRAAMPGHLVLGGMVPFNITRTSDGRFHQGTIGPLVVEARENLAEKLVGALNESGISTQTHADIRGVLYGKLLFNLNNALNALAGIPLREELLDPEYRRILADAIEEGERVYRAANIHAVPFGRMRPGMVAFGLRLPTWLFTRAAKAMLAIDAEARSSMFDDLEKRRLTEIEELNGEIVRLGLESGVETPINSRIVARIRDAENLGQGSPRLDARQIRGLTIS